MVHRLLFTAICVLIAALSVPLILRLVKPNLIYGFRTPLTLSSPEIWYPANAFAGWALLIASLVSSAGFWLVPEGLFGTTETALAILIIPMTTAITVTLIYLRRFRT